MGPTRSYGAPCVCLSWRTWSFRFSFFFIRTCQVLQDMVTEKSDQTGFRFPTIVIFTSSLRMLSLCGNYWFISLRMEGTTQWVAHNRSVEASSKPLRKRAVVCWWMLQWTRWCCSCCGLWYARWSSVTPLIAIVGFVLDLGMFKKSTM